MTVELIGTRAEVRRRGGIVPSWVLFSMILLAISAVCVTVNMRTQTKAQLAAVQLSTIETEVESLRNVNQTLRNDVEKLKTDPRTIELAARKLNMVRSNEYMIPVE
jgi:cell division protein FtsB